MCNFIDGKFVKPDGEKYLDNPNPATQDLLAKIPSSDVKDINTAVAAAKQAFSTWSATSCKVRADFLDKIADALETRLEELAILGTYLPSNYLCMHACVLRLNIYPRSTYMYTHSILAYLPSIFRDMMKA